MMDFVQTPRRLWTTPSRKRRGFDRDAVKLGLREWSDRHHVVESRRNTCLPSDRRVFFDVLPQLRVRKGAYESVPYVSATDVHADCVFEDALKWRWAQYPEFSRPPSPLNSLAASRTTLASVQDLERAHLDFAVRSEPSYPSTSPRQSPRKPAARAAKLIVKSAISGPPELLHFVAWAENKFGNLVNIWRKLDEDGNMVLKRAEFAHALHGLGYDKDVHKLWNILTRSSEDDVIYFLEFVPDLAIDLARFKRWCEEEFGGVKAAFRAFDTNANGRLSHKEFQQGCEKFGMFQRLKDIVRTLFIIIDDNCNKLGLGEITETELEFLEKWKCPAYLWTEPDWGMKKQFFNMLVSANKGCPLIAWRKALDTDGNMKVSYSEFYKACSKLLRSGSLVVPVGGTLMPSGARSSQLLQTGSNARGHNNIALINRIYVTFDPCRSGYISLRRWDPQTYQLLVNFTHFARKEFGKVSSAVRALEREPGVGISISAFRGGVKGLGLCEADLKTLFAGLSLEGVAIRPGRITIEELTFLDNWDPDKMLEEELAWERMVGSKFAHSGSAQAHKISSLLPGGSTVIGAVQALDEARTAEDRVRS